MRAAAVKRGIIITFKPKYVSSVINRALHAVGHHLMIALMNAIMGMS